MKIRTNLKAGICDPGSMTKCGNTQNAEIQSCAGLKGKDKKNCEKQATSNAAACIVKIGC